MKYPNDPATRYALDVTEGRIVAGRLAIWACQRHLDDLAASPESGWVYRPYPHYSNFEYFCKQIKAYKGHGKGKPIELYGWNKFCFGNILGWRQADDESRARFSTAWMETGRKNAKTFPCALFSLYTMAYGERAAEIFSAATKEGQAKIVVEMAIKLIQYPPNKKFLGDFHVSLGRVYLKSRHASMVALPKTADSLDGHEPLVSICDESHAYKNAKMWGVLESGSDTCKNPILLAPTTAGDDPDGFGARKHRLYSDMLDPRTETKDDKIFIFIASLDIYTQEEKAADPTLEDDDPYDPAVWIKSNPALGEAFGIEKLHAAAHSAKTDPDKVETYEVRRMNLWGGHSQKSWMSSKRWDDCYGTWHREAFENSLDKLASRGAPAFGGICASSSTAMASFVLAFPTDRDNPGGITVVPWFFLPSEELIEKPKLKAAQKDAIRDRHIAWDKQGLIVPVPGKVISENFLYDYIRKLRDRFNIQEIVYRSAQTKTLGGKLADLGIKVLTCSNTEMIEPTRLIGSAIIEEKLRHFGHPILRYNFLNTALKMDADGESGRPIKRMGKDSQLHIPGVLAMVYAHSAAQYEGEAEEIDDTYGCTPAGGKRAVMW